MHEDIRNQKGRTLDEFFLDVVGFDVSGPLNVSVGRVHEKAEVQGQERPLSGQDMNHGLYDGIDVPGDPLLS